VGLDCALRIGEHPVLSMSRWLRVNCAYASVTLYRDPSANLAGLLEHMASVVGAACAAPNNLSATRLGGGSC